MSFQPHTPCCLPGVCAWDAREQSEKVKWREGGGEGGGQRRLGGVEGRERGGGREGRGGGGVDAVAWPV